MSEPGGEDAEGPDLRSRTIGLLLNTASGSCRAESRQELEEILSQAGLQASHTWCGGGEEIQAALAAVHSGEVDLLVVLGGDGTIRAAAEACANRQALLIPLPGGTMNMLPRALYGDASWQEALRATLAAPRLRPVHGGKVGDDRFFIAAILGAPSLWAEAREAVREGDISEAARRSVEALSHAFSEKVRYEVDGRNHGAVEAVSLLCPLNSAALPDEEEVFEVAAIDPGGPLDAVRMALTRDPAELARG
ncbi:NAD(+)/NADH kinase [Phenylobacterium sp. J426]|uniref:diacylglycerol/lipid kinase family protein n=1 Tax=Phenylobacterium sp. J426 TaxID=2898439 RepID=UPI002150BD96|nr:diacylglycerol kinase family protein [Phenylobacterium sp. J426]MCR5876895.1 NAD(+)/NADH kinase [Phenylobacterium sp. J426]